MIFSSTLNSVFSKSRNYFKLNGEIEGNCADYIYLDYEDSNRKLHTDSSIVINGKFCFKGNISKPTVAFIYNNRKQKKYKNPNFSDLYLEPGRINIILKCGNFKGCNILGSKSQNEYNLFLENQKSEQRLLDSLNLFKESARLENQIKIVEDKIQLSKSKLKNIVFAFFNKYPKSYVTLNNLIYYSTELSTDSLNYYYEGFDNKMRNTTSAEMLREELMRRRKALPGTKAPDFITVDSHNRRVNLSEYIGNNVVLIFWASWCAPCRHESPWLRKLYLESDTNTVKFIGISDDINIQNWKTAILKDNIDLWPHVLSRITSGISINDLYGIISLPAIIVINTKGFIIKRYTANNLVKFEEVVDTIRELIK